MTLLYISASVISDAGLARRTPPLLPATPVTSPSFANCANSFLTKLATDPTPTASCEDVSIGTPSSCARAKLNMI